MFDDRCGVDKTQRCQGGVVADAGVGVFDGVFDVLVVAQRQGEQQGRNEFQAAAQVVHFVDPGQGAQRADRSPGRLDLQCLEGLLLFPAQVRGASYVYLQRHDCGVYGGAQVADCCQQGLVSLLLLGDEGFNTFHLSRSFHKIVGASSMILQNRLFGKDGINAAQIVSPGARPTPGWRGWCGRRCAACGPHCGVPAADRPEAGVPRPTHPPPG